MYREQVQRQDLGESATSLDHFYQDLEMVVTIAPGGRFRLPAGG